MIILGRHLRRKGDVAMQESPSPWIDIVFCMEAWEDGFSNSLRIGPLSCGVGDSYRPNNLIFADIVLRTHHISVHDRDYFALGDLERLHQFLISCRSGAAAPLSFQTEEGVFRLAVGWCPEKGHAEFQGKLQNVNWNWLMSVAKNPLLARQLMEVSAASRSA